MNKQLKIIFFITLKHISSFDFDTFLQNEIGLSGTDSQLLKRAHQLSAFFDVYIYSDVALKSEISDIFFVHDLNIERLIKHASNVSNIIILNYRSDETTKQVINISNVLNLKLILWCHNGPYPEWFEFLTGAKSIHRIVCVSQGQLNYHRHHTLFLKSTYIYNSICLNDYPINKRQQDAEDIYYLGSLTPNTGFHNLAKIWPNIRKKYPNINLKVIGSGKLYDRTNKLGNLGIAAYDYEEILKKYIGRTEQEIAAQGIYFLGLLSPQQINKEISNAYLGVVNPNVSGSFETFCVSAIEFQALNIPVLGGNKLGLKETIRHQKTGLLHSNEKEFEKNLIKLIEDKAYRKNLSLNTREFVKAKFEDEIINKEWRELILAVNQNKKNTLLKLKLSNGYKVFLKEIFRQLNSS